MIGLSRIHCLLGDYYLALKSLSNIDLNKKGLHSKVVACYVTAFYYVGFCYFMLKRYLDASKSFSHILTYIARTKQYQTNKNHYYQFISINKKVEQMYALLSVSQFLAPTRLDEQISNNLRDNYGHYTTELENNSGDALQQIYEQIFNFASPKFVNPTFPDYALMLEQGLKDVSRQMSQAQCSIFVNQMLSDHQVTRIKNYLKLYTTMPIEKLTNFINNELSSSRNNKQSSPTTKPTSATSGEEEEGDKKDSKLVDDETDEEEFLISKEDCQAMVMATKLHSRQRRYNANSGPNQQLLDGQFQMIGSLQYFIQTVKLAIYIYDFKERSHYKKRDFPQILSLFL